MSLSIGRFGQRSITVKGKPAIDVEKKATLLTHVRKVSGAVEPLVGAGELAIVVGERVTSRENSPRVGVEDMPIQEASKKVWIVPLLYLESSTAPTTKMRWVLRAIKAILA